MQLFSKDNCHEEDLESRLVGSYSSDEDVQNMPSLETPFGQMSILSNDQVNEPSENIQDLLQSFGFSKYTVPALLCRHPLPATGRDDDITKIKEILDDVLLKMG
ncbi:hypothetical protein DPMN_155791 [Dreissena polymorpha]|uniref:Uncharacterized protein n=1 Tax=Dreissena polymorpha TaxID=45954 RepID=A0A9D4FPH5_DREPO|nr:hypothetical protein DPMN_155791 [Dreissena polymorpha]